MLNLRERIQPCEYLEEGPSRQNSQCKTLRWEKAWCEAECGEQ